jgi:hypothetical protein
VVGRPIRGGTIERRIYLARLNSRTAPAAMTALERYISESRAQP